MQWSEQYSLGIEEVDAQHRVLVAAIDDLEAAIANPDHRQRWTNIYYAIERLSEWGRVHFAVEEALMRILRYPDAERHAAEHLVFTNYLKDLEQRALEHNVDESEIIAYLKNWLFGHIQQIDRQYSNYFQALLNFSDT
jgi:hemerythrin